MYFLSCNRTQLEMLAAKVTWLERVVLAEHNKYLTRSWKAIVSVTAELELNNNHVKAQHRHCTLLGDYPRRVVGNGRDSTHSRSRQYKNKDYKHLTRTGRTNYWLEY